MLRRCGRVVMLHWWLIILPSSLAAMCLCCQRSERPTTQLAFAFMLLLPLSVFSQCTCAALRIAFSYTCSSTTRSSTTHGSSSSNSHHYCHQSRTLLWQMELVKKMKLLMLQQMSQGQPKKEEKGLRTLISRCRIFFPTYLHILLRVCCIWKAIGNLRCSWYTY